MSLNIASKGSQHRIPNDSSNESILLVRIFRPENTHACISNLLINNDQHLQSYCTSGQLKSIPIHLMEFYKQLPWRITCPWHITCKGITGPGMGCSGRYVKYHQNWVNTHEQPHVLPPPINTLDRIDRHWLIRWIRWQKPMRTNYPLGRSNTSHVFHQPEHGIADCICQTQTFVSPLRIKSAAATQLLALLLRIEY